MNARKVRMILSDTSFGARQSAIWEKNKVLSELYMHEKMFLAYFLKGMCGFAPGTFCSDAVRTVLVNSGR